ncbi:SDR family NAD(P)-dependent oxidoreductase [Reyranella sp. CPCC 100927]|uniref:SDR family NAD(P)-dependent oxidoreductase n=1 Tax=Reyranella sp. CPCC 100927 TaxID=2599616 RepID=UPI0011B81EC5|nr:SDR family NAD(P)-dependent oxidoreductase [Reyranella sp. CPCC 100927]TWT15619.1 SDR family oxidoreductase [Reyranella sp. CPCC 100927]
MSDLTGRRAFVTGAAKGIGAAIARRLATLGAEVIVADIDASGADALATEIGGRAVALDVSDSARVEQAIADTGPFAILVNNAGVDQHAFFTSTTADDWQRLMGVNLLSVLATVHGALPGMQAARHGRIVNIVSEAARVGSKGGAVYAAAKGGVIAFSKSIARENARFGITVNCIAPGPIDTPLLRAGVARGGDKLLAAMVEATLVKRLGTPDEVAAAVAFLASDDAGFITGETLGVSGGMGLGGS